MDKGFNILQKIINATNMRHKVITSNLANVDTPGYKAKDVTFGNILGETMKLMTTDPGHIGGGENNKVSGEVIVQQDLSWGDQNNVELNVEVAKMTENSLLHNAALRILNSEIKMYKAAIKGGR
jgi:flagellar basal-body rod protein FlgB